MDCLIRKVQHGDEFDLAYIQTESWKAAFKDILSAEILQMSTNLNRATAMYKRLLDENVGNGYILEVDSHPHCIAWWDTARDNDMPDYAELICIHSLQDNWRKGFGTQMMRRVMGNMRAAGYDKVIFCAEKHHPYTVGLFGSIPNLNVKVDRLSPIPGLMPDPTNLPEGCPFAPRCNKCMPICEKQKPGVYQDGEHQIRCHLFTGAAKGGQ